MANLILQNQGTILTWADSGATYAITLKGLATGVGRQGETHNFGVGAVAGWFMWFLQVQFDTGTAPVLDETVDAYLKTSPDGVNWDNDDGEGDIALSNANKLKNLKFLGSVFVDEAAADVPIQRSGFVTIVATEVAPVIDNQTADTLDDDAAPTDSLFKLIEVPLEIQ